MLFRNATVFTGTELVSQASVRVENGRILEVNTTDVSEATPNSIDLAGDYLVPGFVDLQVYGGTQVFLNQAPTANTVRHILNAHRRCGTTSVLPTLFTAPQSVLMQAAEAVREVMHEQPFGVLGFHAEGPYISPDRRGVHPAAAICTPNLDQLAHLFGQYGDVLSLMTLAPEQFTPEQWTWLLAHKPARLQLSIGHSNATYGQARRALNEGVTLATHLYNAMRGFESREPGVVGAVFDHPTVQSSLVADGFHCDPVSIRLAHRLLGNRLFLISDALLIRPQQHQFWLTADMPLHYENGRILNHQNQLAGSAITLLDAVQLCVEQVGISLPNALQMASTVPAQVAGFGHTLGKIAPGYVANLLRLDHRLELQNVWIEGSPVM
ncbi:N-acetylglucosamine-6-phosphate deacetylase [Rudanella paleaurantiibacter]|uniref:N-acetylglucosamine-6-phosphate deacetylase n=1 Tax=Rudanella paleaurantiibacter TaxID=2614655 RepID=A0A7J5TU85_9BACT|nr:N-acetylglucosamine-6-phosphate deacetylase [Rudanella paleaurantiibacter]KAB7725962.1 N-acetylglucosamine-6-phosphate deacetylase [Rudanella paleaurantiibacter]